MLPKSWKKSFNNISIILTKLRFCIECIEKRICNRCNNQVTGNKEFEANLKLLKREAPNEIAHMFPCFKE